MSSPPMLRTSERSSLKKCEFHWDLQFNRRLKTASPHQESPALRFGTLVHKSLEKFYKPGIKRGPKPATTFEKLYNKQMREVEQQFNIRIDDEWRDAGELGVGMLEGYYDTYGKDELYQVIATEQPFEIPVFVKGRHRFTYVGVLDGIWRNRSNKRLLIVDHKTAKSIEALIKSLALDEQAGAYWTYGVEWLYDKGILRPSQKLSGLLFNILRKSIEDDDRPRNEKGQYLNKPKKDALLAEYERRGKEPPSKKVDNMIEDLGPESLLLGEVSKRQDLPFFHRHPNWRDEADKASVRERVTEEARRMRLIRAGKLKVVKSPGMINCNGCPYQGPCELHETGADFEQMLKAGYKTWDPYAEHEVYEGR